METKQENKKTACDELREVLERESEVFNHTIFSGGGIGLSSSCDSVVIPHRTNAISSYDKDTNKLLRAYLACKMGMFKSPLSDDNHSIYVSEEHYEQHLQEKQDRISKKQDQISKEPSEQCSIM